MANGLKKTLKISNTSKDTIHIDADGAKRYINIVATDLENINATLTKIKNSYTTLAKEKKLKKIKKTMQNVESAVDKKIKKNNAVKNKMNGALKKSITAYAASTGMKIVIDSSGDTVQQSDIVGTVKDAGFLTGDDFDEQVKNWLEQNPEYFDTNGNYISKDKIGEYIQQYVTENPQFLDESGNYISKDTFNTYVEKYLVDNGYGDQGFEPAISGYLNDNGYKNVDNLGEDFNNYLVNNGFQPGDPDKFKESLAEYLKTNGYTPIDKNTFNQNVADYLAANGYTPGGSGSSSSTPAATKTFKTFDFRSASSKSGSTGTTTSSPSPVANQSAQGVTINTGTNIASLAGLTNLKK